MQQKYVYLTVEPSRKKRGGYLIENLKIRRQGRPVVALTVNFQIFIFICGVQGAQPLGRGFFACAAMTRNGARRRAKTIAQRLFRNWCPAKAGHLALQYLILLLGLFWVLFWSQKSTACGSECYER